MTLLELHAEIAERGRVHTPWSGAIDMLDGINYYGNVWRLTGKNAGLYIYYQNKIFRVYWSTKNQRYGIGP